MQLKYKNLIFEGTVEEVLLISKKISKQREIIVNSNGNTSKSCVICKNPLNSSQHRLCGDPVCSLERKRQYSRKYVKSKRNRF